mgnify:CR=1
MLPLFIVGPRLDRSETYVHALGRAPRPGLLRREAPAGWKSEIIYSVTLVTGKPRQRLGIHIIIFKILYQLG